MEINMAARAVRQKYTPAKVNVQPPARGKAVKTGKDDKGVKQQKF